MSGFFTVLIGLGVLGLMVVIHEWGHYLAARYFKVRVLTFSVGFGPRLFGIRRGDTDFCVRAIPLGGYVKMAGENPFEERENAPDEFYSKPRWQRSIIAFAGPLVNILVAVFMLAGLYMVSYEREAYLDSPPQLAGVIPDSPAEAAGLQSGDLVLAIDGEPVDTWEKATLRTILRGGEELLLKIRREDRELEIRVTSEIREEDEIAYIGWNPRQSIAIEAIAPDMPAERAGLEPGDEIIAFDGEIIGLAAFIAGENSFRERVQRSAGEPMTLTIRRGEETFERSLSAEKSDWAGEALYAIGIRLGIKKHTTQLGLTAALEQAVAKNWELLRLMGTLARRLVTGQTSMNAVQGPIGITMISGQAARLGMSRLIELMALISINLGVLNLLPIPILDGGHIAMFAVEGMIRRDLSLRLKERFLQFGFLVMMLLFVVVMYNDIVRYFFR